MSREDFQRLVRQEWGSVDFLLTSDRSERIWRFHGVSTFSWRVEVHLLQNWNSCVSSEIPTPQWLSELVAMPLVNTP